MRTRNALIDAARVVVAERGAHGATIQEITDAADVAKGSFYNHFASREDVLRAVAAKTLDELGSALDESLDRSTADPASVIARSLYVTLRSCVEDPVLGGFVLRTVNVVDIAEAALGHRGRRDLIAGMKSGRFHSVDVEVLVSVIAGAAASVIRKRLRDELSAEAEVEFVAFVLVALGLPREEARSIAVTSAEGE